MPSARGRQSERHRPQETQRSVSTENCMMMSFEKKNLPQGQAGEAAGAGARRGKRKKGGAVAPPRRFAGKTSRDR